MSRKPYLVRCSAFALCFVAAPAASAVAQQSDSAAGLGTPAAVDSSVGASRPAATDSGRHVDKTFFTRQDAIATGIALVASVAVSSFDVRIRDWTQSPSVQGSQSRHNLVSNLTKVNEGPLTIGAFATYGIGRLIHSETVADVGLHTTEALVLTIAVSEAIRGPLGRARPTLSPTDQYNFTFWGGFTNFAERSYPSMHAAVGWATATALASEIHERDPKASRWAAPLLYTAALIPGFTRMYLDQHWASDILAGSFAGAMMGATVVRYAHSHRRNKLDKWLLGTNVVPTSASGFLVTRSVEW